LEIKQMDDKDKIASLKLTRENIERLKHLGPARNPEVDRRLRELDRQVSGDAAREASDDAAREALLDERIKQLIAAAITEHSGAIGRVLGEQANEIVEQTNEIVGQVIGNIEAVNKQLTEVRTICANLLSSVTILHAELVKQYGGPVDLPSLPKNRINN
jgi:hypothetical protein